MDGLSNRALYRHRQIGWPTILTCGGLLVAFGCAAIIDFLQEGTPTATEIKGLCFTFVPTFLLLVAMLISFSGLTVLAADDFIEVRLGPGVIRKKFRFADIQECKVIRNSRLVNFRWFRGDWVFSGSGFYAIELLLKNGKRYRIGTDEPEQLREVIQRKLSGSAH